MNFDGENARGRIRSDPHRADLRNLFLTRNDSLINNFEEHMLLMNLGNIDWRALINLWSVLDYLTKYAGKGGKGAKHLGKLFEGKRARLRSTWCGKGIRSSTNPTYFNVGRGSDLFLT